LSGWVFSDFFREITRAFVFSVMWRFSFRVLPQFGLRDGGDGSAGVVKWQTQRT
jgi:hypothetical protein